MSVSDPFPIRFRKKTIPPPAPLKRGARQHSRALRFGGGGSAEPPVVRLRDPQCNLRAMLLKQLGHKMNHVHHVGSAMPSKTRTGCQDSLDSFSVRRQTFLFHGAGSANIGLMRLLHELWSKLSFLMFSPSLLLGFSVDFGVSTAGGKMSHLPDCREEDKAALQRTERTKPRCRVIHSAFSGDCWES